MRRDERRKSHGRGPQRDKGSYGGGGFRGGSGGWHSEPREMHKATCAECGSSCEVPFKPTEGRPVYCKECFRSRKPRF